ncbi:hypothetical protein D3C80_1718090 [compost metagenome]
MVEHSSRRSYDNMRFLRQLDFLRGERLLAEHSGSLDPLEASDIGNILFDLCRQLPGRGKYQNLRLILRPVHQLADGDAE